VDLDENNLKTFPLLGSMLNLSCGGNHHGFLIDANNCDENTSHDPFESGELL